MADPKVKIISREEQTVFGLWKKSNDRTVSVDIKALSEQYRKTAETPGETVLPLVVLSRNFEEQTKDFEMFIGSTKEKEGLEPCLIPAGEYAVITIRPGLGFLWGAFVGRAKRYFYTKWIRENPYEALNMEFEYHTEKSVGTRPEADILFAVRKKTDRKEHENEI